MICVAAAYASTAFAVTAGQEDTFSDGTTQSWVVSLRAGETSPNPPINVPSGGPAGANDRYLLLTSNGGFGAGSRLTVINQNQWSGDFTSAGVTAIAMNLNNFGATELQLRLVFVDGIGGNEAFSEPIVVPAGSGWTSVTFPILPEDLTPDFGTASGALSNTQQFRISHSPDAAHPGPPIVATLGVDDITAVGPLDTDGDGIADDVDDCTLVANPTQIDADQDGFGNACDPDFDENGIVNAADLARLKQVFFRADALADLNGDGVVNAVDLARLKAAFFKAPGPSGLACAGQIPCPVPAPH